MSHGHEPAQWKGGLLVTALKQKGDVTLPASHRSLLISSHAGKAIHRAIRQGQSTLMQAFLDSSQLGGRPKVPVGIGLREVRAHLRIQKLRGRAAALVFVDLREAFYRIIRALALDHPFTDESVAHIVRIFALPAHVVHDLHEHLRNPNALASAGLSPAQCRAVAAVHSSTWFKMNRQQDTVATTRGSRPGDSFADVIFSYVYSRVVTRAKSQLHAQEILDCYPKQASSFHPSADQNAPEEPHLGPTWMDDTCIMISAVDSEKLVSKTTVATSAFLDECRGHGLTANLSAGKTEIILSLRGKGTKKIKQTYFAKPERQKLPVLCEGGLESLSLVGEYLRLGGVVSHDGRTHRRSARYGSPGVWATSKTSVRQQKQRALRSAGSQQNGLWNGIVVFP